MGGIPYATKRWNPGLRFAEPLKWRKPQVIFVWPHRDLAHAEAETVQRLFRVMGDAQQHQFLVLTKWPQLLLEMLCEKPGGYRCWKCIGGGYSYVLQRDRRGKLTGGSDLGNCGCKHGWRSYPFEAISFTGDGGSGWIGPFANVWVGVSATDQATYDERVPVLCDPETGWPGNKFVSLEPCLGPVNLWSDYKGQGFRARATYLEQIKWIIAGSADTLAHGAVAFTPEIARSIVTQCKQASVPVWIKQAAWYMSGPDVFDEEWVHEDPILDGHHHLAAPPAIAAILRERSTLEEGDQ